MFVAYAPSLSGAVERLLSRRPIDCFESKAPDGASPQHTARKPALGSQPMRLYDHFPGGSRPLLEMRRQES